jgi:hypothetical protein
MKVIRWFLVTLVTIVMVSSCSWLFTKAQLARARANGLYDTPEQGMLAHAEKYYTADREVKILYAGTNSFDGTQPHIWYVIAEIRASAHADGSELGDNGCDAPGSFFLQTKDGWVHVPEGAFPGFIGFWMNVFGWAGEGQPTPSTNWGPDSPDTFCQ